MKVGLIGFGRTGRAVAGVLLNDEEVSLEWVVRRSDRLEHRSVPEFLGVESDEPGLIYSKSEFSAGQLLDQMPVDAIIDFSSAEGLDYYGEAAAARGVAIVTAVSNYSDAKQRELVELSARTRVLWSPNITIGINFMLLAAQTLQRIAPGIDIQIVEEHFRDKADVSGTALRIANALDLSEERVHSVRAGGIIGVHELLFGFPAQTVRLRHEAISRDAFGNGALFAAKKLVSQPVGYYRMENLLLPYFASEQPHERPSLSHRRMRGRVASSLRSIARRLDSSTLARV